MEEFNFSEKYIQNKFRYIMVIFLSTTLFIVTASLLKSGGKSFISELVFIFTMLFLLGIQKLFISRIFRKMKVQIYEDRIVKQNTKNQQVAFWNDIIKIKLVENIKKELVHIRLSLVNKQKIKLFGFNNMDEIANLIYKKIPNEISVQKKQYNVDWDNPMMGIVVVLAVLVFMNVISSMGQKTEDVFFILFNLGLLVCVLVFRPLSKNNIGFRKLEIIVVVLLVIALLFMFIGAFLIPSP